MQVLNIAYPEPPGLVAKSLQNLLFSINKLRKSLNMHRNTQTSQRWSQWINKWGAVQQVVKLAFMGIVASALVACGGGGDNGVVASPSIGGLASGVKVIGSEVLDASDIKGYDVEGNLTVDLKGAAGDYADGQLVYIEPNSENGLTFGYSGKIQKQSDGTVKLQHALISEIVDNINFSFDSKKNDMRVVGLIAPPNSNVVFKEATKISQVGLFDFVRGGSSDDSGLSGQLVGEIKINDEIKIKLTGALIDVGVKSVVKTKAIEELPPCERSGAGQTLGTTIQAPIPCPPLRARDFDEISSAITGDVKIKLTLEGSKNFSSFKESEGNTLPTDLSEIWSQIESKHGLTGLTAEDKKGLIPLAGFVMTPVGATGFAASGSEVAVIGAKGVGGVILWIYLDMYNNIELKGELDIVDVEFPISREFSLKPKGEDELRVDEPPGPTVDSRTKISSGFRDVGVDFDARQGLTFALDLFAAGTRPFTFQVQPLGLRENLDVSGNVSVNWYPGPVRFSGDACINKAAIDFGGYARAYARIGYNVKIGGWSSSAAGELKYEKDWAAKNIFTLAEPGCLYSISPVDFQFNPKLTEKFSAGRQILEVDLNDAFSKIPESQRDDISFDFYIQVDEMSGGNVVNSIKAKTGVFKKGVLIGEVSPVETVLLDPNKIYRVTLNIGVFDLPSFDRMRLTREVTTGEEGVILKPKLPHTGITANQCYAAGGSTLLACSQPGALALNGQQDGHRSSINAMSYSQVPHVSLAGVFYTKNDCVKDNVTGLVWEGKTANNDFRDYRKTYTYWGDGRAGDASAYVAAVNAAWLCGKNDWRLPTVDELQTIVDYGKGYPGPTVNLDWFVNTGSGGYWSSSPNVGNTSGAWGVHFNNGVVSGFSRNFNYRVRLVRASQ